MARADELEFRQQVLRELGVLSDYVERERDTLLREITALRQQLQRQADASRAERDSATASQ